MPSLSEATERATNGLYRAGEALEEILSVVARFMPRTRLAQPYDATLKGVLWLLAVVAIDHIAGHPAVLQLLYLAPIWIAFEKGGVGVAAVLAAAAVPVATFASPTAPWGTFWDVVVRSALMVSLVAIMTFHSLRYRTTHESARRDSLTGALNRAGFENAAREAIEHALAEGRPLTVAVVDCDNFKELNDLKGHAFGDAVLRTLVRTLGSNVEGAALGRTGGDEFVLFDSVRDAAGMREALTIALKRYTDATLVLGRRSTFTVGIAQLGPDGMRYESLLEAADRDMYRGKYERHREVFIDPRATSLV